MSVKDFFNDDKKQFLSTTSINELTGNLESGDYISAFVKKRNRFSPLIDFSKPANFARFGSAEKYYYDSINHITNTYPYDGSRKEKILWELSSSHLDLYLLENGYPRTTGFAVFSTSSISAIATSEGYGAAGSGTYEYIFVNGGPHAGTGKNIYIDPDTGEAQYREDANIYSFADNRECNLKIGGIDGNTVEFWLKKEAFNPSATTKEVILDIHTTSSISSSADYGRLRIEMSGHGAATSTTSPFYVTYMSGTAGFANQNIGTSLTTASIADDKWHHYAFRFKNSGSNITTDLFVDGQHNARISTGTTIEYVSGTIVGTIGALSTHPSGGTSPTPQATKGWGKLSGSLDEFRFWKTFRNSEQIQTRWFDQVGGGTNTDKSNTHLGVYYKFNEGITLTASIDEKVLDYSGRVSNGAWTGYDAGYSRNTGSAIDQANATLTTFSGSEFRDPIIYQQNNAVKDFLSSKRAEGKEYDYTNPSSIYYSMPGWILNEQDVADTADEGLVNNSLWNLTQIIGSYFDDVANHIKSMPELGQATYFSGSTKAPPFMDRIVESSGFITPEIFTALSALEKFEDRDNTRIFSKDVSEVKNIIYRNIYNNLSYINKSKGVEKSFRNLIRCFGVDDEIYRFNVYANNAEFTLENNFRPVSQQYKMINFNTTGCAEGVVYQFDQAGNSNSISYLSASGLYTTAQEGAGLPFSVEANILFPNRVGEGDYRTLRNGATEYQNNYPLMLTSSLFGMHTADTGSSETTWVTAPYQDYANFLVRAVKSETYGDKAYFALTGTEGGFLPALSSSIFDDVYNNSNWNFLVSLYPAAYPNANQVSGTEESSYVVEFSGMQTVLDTTINEFTSTGSISEDQARFFLGSPKRLFVGAHRTNFSGGLRQSSDVKFNTVRVWQNKLSIDELRQHAIDPTNYGVDRPAENAYLFNTSIDRVYVPKKETLLLHWNFDNVTGSDASGKFIVDDLTSGSTGNIEKYGWLGNIKNRQLTGEGNHFRVSSTDAVETTEVITGEPNLPEVMTSHDMVNILNHDDIYFTRDKRPIFFDLFVEKSPYQNISSEMMKFIATAKDFNDLIGRPVDRYRTEYKDLSVLRNLFFQNVANEPDVDKYMEYFKWFDIAVSSMIQKLAPMSSGLDDRPLRTVIESHILERNKYQSKFPTYEFKQSDPEGALFGVNEMLYDWEHGHKPVGEDEQGFNCPWWHERASRSNPLISSGDTNIDADRQKILDSINNLNNATPPILSASAGSYSGSAYALRRFAQPYKITAKEQPFNHGGVDFNRNRRIDYVRSGFRAEFDSTSFVSITSYTPTSSCNDEHKPNQKVFRNYEVDGIKSNIASPFNIVSASLSAVEAPRAGVYGTNNDLQVTNLHYDAYGPDAETPMQGPFTDAHVGGSQYRHVPMNTGDDTQLNRPELFRLTTSGDSLNILNADQRGDGTSVEGDNALPRAEYYRNEIAKRPLNIANISYNTSSAILGNFQHNYEVVLTNGAEINNRYLVKSEGALLTASTDSYFVSGVVDYELPRRDLTGSTKSIIVNRFSAPGDPATMGQGMLDVLSGQYSIYNCLVWRNWAVRAPQLELLTDHCKQFGYFSDAQYSSSWFRAIKQGITSSATYPGTSGSVDEEHYYHDSEYTDATASFHKINRNTRKVIQYDNEYLGDLGIIKTASVFDNGFVTHQIPQSDRQYAWITQSAENFLLGFEQPDFSNASLASTDISFVSASNFGTYLSFSLGERYLGATDLRLSGIPTSGAFIFTDFAGLNGTIYEPVSSSANFLGYDGISVGVGSTFSNYRNPTLVTAINGTEEHDPGIQAALNAILLNRQGPYGGASWKMYKKDNHPVVRTHRKENRLSYLTQRTVTDSDGYPLAVTEITSVSEPGITNKYQPLVHRLKVKQNQSNEEAQAVQLKHSYVNNVAYFNDHIDNDETNLNEKLLSTRNLPTAQQTLDVVNYYLFGGELLPKLNPVKEFESLEIKETVYPKAKNTYLSRTRQRENFKNNFWRTDRTVRSSEDNGSVYPFLDLDRNFSKTKKGVESTTICTASMWPMDARLAFLTGSPGRVMTGTEGKVSGFSAFDFVSGGSDQAGVLQINCAAFNMHTTSTSLLYRRFFGAASLFPQYNRRMPGTLATDTRSTYLIGDTLWEVNKSGSQIPRHKLIAPAYDTYDDYIDDLKRAAKNYGILPEYRISDHMDFFVNQKNGDFLAENTASFSITGSTTDLSSSVNTGFFKTYSHTDFLKSFKLVNTEYSDKSNVKTVTLEADAAIKFLPYNGFYPAQRTVQLAKLWFESYQDTVNLTASSPSKRWTMTPVQEPGLSIQRSGFVRPIFQSLFAPGILFNSIKSGIGVDYPVNITGSGYKPSLTFTGAPGVRYQGSGHNSTGLLKNIPRINTGLNYRVPFEGLLDPEGYISGRYFLDSEPHPSASITNLTCSIGTGRPTYRLAMNNFLASTIDFFKPDGNLTTIASVADTDPSYGGKTQGGFQAGKEYVMRITCHNAQYNSFKQIKELYTENNQTKLSIGSASFAVNRQSCVMYAQTGSNANVKQSDYHGSAFGPPCSTGLFDLAGPLATTGPADSDNYFLFGSGAFEPFTPPYFDGYSHIELTFRPQYDGFIPITTVVSELTQSLYRATTWTNVVPALAGFSQKQAMQLSASLNYLQIADEPNVTFDPITGQPKEINGSSADIGQKLVIQPKWETPILNFKNAQPTLPLIGSGSIARGMWHQYGELPKNDEGVFLQIQDIDPTEFKVSDSTGNPVPTGSLADILGFKKDSVRLGEVAQEKVISEAIVAIPFIVQRGEQQRYKIPPATFKLAQEAEKVGGVQNLNPATVTALLSELGDASPPDQAMVDMISKMKKFVIPPHLDFVTNSTVDPFAMFILDFNVVLNQNDLLNIWQNIAPEIGRTFQKKAASLPMNIFDTNNLTKKEIVEQGGATPLSFFSEDTQWMVFKVKERAAFNYFAKTADSRDDERFKFNFEIGSQGAEITSVPDYSYNWPFDFFSLIELAKVDATIKLEPTEDFKTPRKNYPQVTAEEIVKQTEVFGIPFAGAATMVSKAEELNEEEPSEETTETVSLLTRERKTEVITDAASNLNTTLNLPQGTPSGEEYFSDKDRDR